MDKSSQRIALEKRVLLDAAIAATAVDAVTADNSAETEVQTNADDRQQIAELGVAFSEAKNRQQSADESGDDKVLVVVDGRVSDLQGLAQLLPDSAQVVTLDLSQDGVEQIANLLQTSGGVDQLHLFSHGSNGELLLGSSSLNTESLGDYQDVLSQWGAHLNPDADILLYGCDVAADQQGQAFVDSLASLTQADVAASTDDTGAADQQGDWDLEYSQGDLNSAPLVITGFDGLLTTAPTLADSFNGSRTITEDATLTVNTVTVNEVDGDTLKVTIHATDSGGSATAGNDFGTVTLASIANLNFSTGDGNQDTTVVFTGLAADVNAALNGLSFIPDQDSHGTGRIAIQVEDDDDAAQVDNLNIDVSISPVNDDPVLTPVALVVAEGAANVPFSTTEFGLTDPDITSGDQVDSQMVIQITNLPTSGTLRFAGSAVALNSVFSYDQVAQLTYSHNGNDVPAGGASDSFSISVNDGAGGTDNATINITLTPVNQAPTLSGNPSQFEGQSKTLGLTLTDQESGHADTPANSLVDVVSLDTDGEGSFYIDLNSNDLIDGGETLTGGEQFAGDQLGLIKFSHNGVEPDSANKPQITLKATDAGGGEGVGNELNSGNQTFEVDIIPVDDDPVLALTNTSGTPKVVVPDTSVLIANTELNVTDIDSPANQLVYTVETRPAEGVLQVNVGGSWQTLGIGGRFTQDDIDNGHLRYTHEVITAGATTDQFTFSVRDSALKAWPNAGEEGGVYEGGVIKTDNTFYFSITGAGGSQATPSAPSPGYGGTSGTPEDNAPVVSSSTNVGIANVEEGSSGILNNTQLDYELASGGGAYIVPADETVFTVTRLPSNGILELDTTGAGNWRAIPVYGTFTQDDIDNGRVRFTQDGGEDFVNEFEFSVGEGGPNRVTGVFSIDVDPINDAPTASGGTVPVTEAAPSAGVSGEVRITSSYITVADPDLANEVGKRVAEGADDPLWFRITSLPVDGLLERWDGAAWQAVTTDDWMSEQLIDAAAVDNGNGGLRYTHGGGDQPAELADAFNFVVRDDLNAPGSAFDIQSQAGLGDPAAPVGNNGAHLSNVGTVTLEVAPYNDPPIVPATPADADTTITDQSGDSHTTVNEILTVVEGGSGTITDETYLKAVDTDNTAVQRQFKITDYVDNGVLKKSGSTLGVGSTFTQDDIDNDRITYEHNGSENFTDAFSFEVSDGIGTDSGTFEIVVTPTNDAPTLSVPSGNQDFFTGAPHDFGNGITIGDSDLTSLAAGESDFLQVTLDLKKGGSTYVGSTLTLGSTTGLAITNGTNGVAGGTLVFQGTRADVQAALTNLQAQVPGDEDGLLQLDVTVDDRLRDGGGNLTAGANGGTTNENGGPINAANNTVTKTITLQASNVNDDPTVPTKPVSVTVNEDTPIAFTGANLIQIADVDAFDKPVTVQLAVANGNLSLSDTSLITAGANNSGSITLTGTVTAINTALAGLSYQGNTDFNATVDATADDTLNIRVNDGGASGVGGGGDINTSVDIHVTPVNDTPTIAGPSAALAFASGNPTFVFSSGNGNAITVADAKDSPFAFNDDLQIRLRVSDGVLDLGNPAGVTVTAGADGSNDFTFHGSLADLNAALEGLTYTPTNVNIDTSVTVTVDLNDLDDGGTAVGGVGPALTASRSFQLNVSGTNDAPDVTKPVDASVNEDSSVTLSGAAAFSIADPDDFGANNLLVTVTATKGTLSLVADDDTIVGGSGTAVMTLTGTEAQINNALDGLIFTPDADFHDTSAALAATITVAINDQGNTGQGGAQTDSEQISVTVNPVNDRPSASGTVTVSAVNEDTANPAGAAFNTLITGAEYSDATDDQTGNSGDNSATALSHVAIIGSTNYVAGQGAWQVSDGSGGWIDIPVAGLSASNALIVPDDRVVRFVPAADFHGNPGTLSVRLADSSNDPAINVSANNADLKDLSANGGTGDTGVWSSGSVTVQTSVTNVNDRPTGANATLAAINEDDSNPAGNTVSNLFGAGYDDPTDDQTAITGGGDASTSLGGIAIIGNAEQVAEGKWQYRNGGAWTDIGTGVSDANALLLPATAELRFLPAADYHGTPGDLSVRLSDAPVGFAASSNISASLTQTDPWSVSHTLSHTVNPQNDAPVLSGTLTNPTIDENNNVGDGTQTLALVTNAAVSDPDFANASFGGGTITVSFTDGYQSDDLLSLNGTPTGVASVTGGNGQALVINLNASATEANIGAIINALRYQHDGDNPTQYGTDPNRAYQIVVNDGDNNATAGGPTALNSNALSGTITFTAKNDPPVAVNDSNSLTEETDTVAGDVRANDTDPDDLTTALTVTEVESAAGNVGNSVAGTYGSVTINANGSYVYDLDNNNAQVQALGVGDAPLTETFTYQIQDPSGLTDTATLTITITPVNDVPTVSGSLPDQTDQDLDVIAGVDVSSVFADTDSTDVPTYSATGLPAGLSINPNTGVISGTLDNSASQGGVGGVHAVTITYSDNEGGSVNAGFNWTVTNPVPTANDNINSVTEETVLSASGNLISDNDGSGVDSDPDNDSISVSQVVGNGANVGNPTAGNYGSVTINANGSYTYNLNNAHPAVQALGAGESLSDSFLYQISDGEGGTDTATLEITINGTNDVPTVSGSLPNQANVDNDNIAGVDVTSVFGDTDTNDSPTYSATGLPAGLSINPSTGIISGTLDNSASQGGVGGVYAVTISYDDNKGGTVNAGFNWTVTNPATTATDNSNDVTEDRVLSASGNLITDDDGSGVDTDPDGDTLTVTQVQGNGANVGNSVNGNYGSVTVNADGSYTYTLDNAHASVQGIETGETLTDTFSYQISDGEGSFDTATLTITINGLDENKAPTATDNSNRVDEDHPNAVGNVLTDDDGSGLDADPEFNILSVSNVVGSTGSNFAITNGSGLTITSAGSYGELILHSDGSYSYDLDTSNPQVTGLASGERLTDLFTYTLSDGDGGTDIATLRILIDPLPEGPELDGELPDRESVDGTSVNNLDVTSVFVKNQPDDILSYSATGLPAGLSIDPDTGLISGVLDPSASQGGTDGVYPVTITATDNRGESVSISFNWTVSNPGPVATDNLNSVTESTAPTAVGNLILDDDGAGVDSDPDGDNLILSQVAGSDANIGVAVDGAYGSVTINADGSYRYSLDNGNQNVKALQSGETLTERFSYQISDGEGGFDSANLIIIIEGVNDGPLVIGELPDRSDLDSDVVSAVDISSAFSGSPGGGALNYRAEGLPPGLSLDPNTGLISGVLDHSASQGGDNGDYRVTVTASDGNGDGNSVSFDWSVTNPAPLAYDNLNRVEVGAVISVAGNLISNDDGLGLDRDPDGDDLQVTAIDGESGSVGQVLVGDYGQITISADGSYRYDLNPDHPAVAALEADQTLTDQFSYQIADGEGGTDTATLRIQIHPAVVDEVPDDGVPDEPPVTDTPVPPPVPSNPVSEPVVTGPGFNESIDSATDTFNSFNDSLSQNDASINPVSLRISLQDQIVGGDGVKNFALPANTFQHTNPNERITVEATLQDGSPLPDYVIFNAQEGSFEVDAPAAVAEGVETIVVRVTGRDSENNAASATFTIILLEQTDEEGLEPSVSADLAVPETGEQPTAEQPQAEDQPVPEQEAGSDAAGEQPPTDLNAYRGLGQQLQTAGLGELEKARTQLLKDIQTLFS